MDDSRLVYEYADTNNVNELKAVLLRLGSNHEMYRDVNGWTALHWAAINNNVECLALLLKANVDKDSIDSNGKTAVHHSVERCNIEILRKLLEYKDINVDILDENGMTALHYAAELNNELSLITLLEFGADSEIKNSEGLTPLHLSVIFGNIVALEMLLEYVIDVNIQDNGGNSILHLAAQNDHIEIIPILLDNDLQRNLKNNSNQTAIELTTVSEIRDMLSNNNTLKTREILQSYEIKKRLKQKKKNSPQKKSPQKDSPLNSSRSLSSYNSLGSYNSANMDEIVNVLIEVIRAIEYDQEINKFSEQENLSVISDLDDAIFSYQDKPYNDSGEVAEEVVETLLSIVDTIEFTYKDYLLENNFTHPIVEQERFEKERHERDTKIEEDRLEKERLESESLNNEAKLVQERLVKERLDKDARSERERLEKERRENERLDSEVRLERERLKSDQCLKADEDELLIKAEEDKRHALEEEREKIVQRKRLAQEKIISEENNRMESISLEIIGSAIPSSNPELLVIADEDSEEVYAYHTEDGVLFDSLQIQEDRGGKSYDIMVFDDQVGETDIDNFIFEDVEVNSRSKFSEDDSLEDQGIFSEKAIYEGIDDNSGTNFHSNIDSTLNYKYEDSAMTLSERDTEKEDNTSISDNGFGLFSEKGIYEAYDDNMNWDDDDNASQTILGINSDDLNALEYENRMLTDSLLHQARVYEGSIDYVNESESSIAYLDSESLGSNKYETINIDELSLYYDDDGKIIETNESSKAVDEPSTTSIPPVKVFEKKKESKKDYKAYGTKEKVNSDDIRKRQHMDKLSEQLWNGRGEGIYKSTQVEDVKSLRLRKLGEEKQMSKIEVTAVAKDKDRSTSPVSEIRPDYKYIQMKERLKSVSREIDPLSPSLPSISSSTSPKKVEKSIKSNKSNTNHQNEKLPNFSTTYKPTGKNESISQNLHAESKNEKVLKLYDAYGHPINNDKEDKDSKRLKDVSVITIDSILNPKMEEIIGIGSMPMGAVDRPSQTPSNLIAKKGDRIELFTVKSEFVTNIYKNALVVSLIVSKKSVPIYNTLVPKSWDPELHLLTYYSLSTETGDAYPGSKVLEDSTLYPERVFVKVYDPALSVESIASINLKECTNLLYAFCRKYTSSIAKYFPITDISWWADNVKHFMIIKVKPNGGINAFVSKPLIENFCSRAMKGLGPSKHPFEISLLKPSVDRSILPESSLIQSSSESILTSSVSTKKKDISPNRSRSPAKTVSKSKTTAATSPSRNKISPAKVKISPSKNKTTNTTSTITSPTITKKTEQSDYDRLAEAMHYVEVNFSPNQEFIASTNDNNMNDLNVISYNTSGSFFEENGDDNNNNDDDVDSNMLLMQTIIENPETNNVFNDSLMSPSWRKKMDVKEKVARAALVRARATVSTKSSFRLRKLTDVEISLFASPFAEPLLAKIVHSRSKDTKDAHETYKKMVDDSVINGEGQSLRSSQGHRRRNGLMASFHMNYET